MGGMREAFLQLPELRPTDYIAVLCLDSGESGEQGGNEGVALSAESDLAHPLVPRVYCDCDIPQALQ